MRKPPPARSASSASPLTGASGRAGVSVPHPGARSCGAHHTQQRHSREVVGRRTAVGPEGPQAQGEALSLWWWRGTPEPSSAKLAGAALSVSPSGADCLGLARPQPLAPGSSGLAPQLGRRSRPGTRELCQVPPGLTLGGAPPRSPAPTRARPRPFGWSAQSRSAAHRPQC